MKKEENGTVVKSETDPIRDVKEEQVKVKEEGKDDEAGAPEDSVVKKEEKFEINGASETDQMKQGKCFLFSHWCQRFKHLQVVYVFCFPDDW